ncbi:hypothetical protein DVH05_028636 [Phytophthora capsici]|nr:hypothetical protein DVH05_028636 [Phytophthora capsici]
MVVIQGRSLRKKTKTTNMTKSRTQTAVEVPHTGMLTRSQSPKTPISVADANTERQVNEKSSNAETNATSQANSTKEASTKATRIRGKQRRVRKGVSDVASGDEDDLESTDSDGPRNRRTKIDEPPTTPQAEPPGIAETGLRKATALGSDNNEERARVTGAEDVGDLRRAVQQLAVAVAEIRREQQTTPATGVLAATLDEPAMEAARSGSQASRGSARQRRHGAVSRVAGRQRHEAERGRSRQRLKVDEARSRGRHGIGQRRTRDRRTRDRSDASDAFSESSSRLSDSSDQDENQRRSRSCGRSTRRYRRAVQRDDSSSSSDESIGEPSNEENHRRSERRGGNPQRTRGKPGDSDGDDSDSSNSDDDESSSASSEQSRSEPRERRQRRKSHRRRGHRRRHERHEREQSESIPRGPLPRPGSIKNLELPVFTPAPGVSAATWVDRVDLALQGAKASGQGEWSDHALYFILGNKLMESAAMWWVTMNQRLTRRQQTWTYLKKELLKRFGPRKNKAAAEWRVNNRTMLNGESYDDFAAGLRRAADRNRVSERVFLAQYYRNLDKTTRQLVKMEPRPKTLEEAVAKTNRIDDPADNIAQGMRNIGQAFPMAPQTQLATVAGTMGQTVVIPGVGGMSLPAELTEAVVNSTTAEPANKDAVTVFTNQQGIWNDYAGIYERPPGRKWNGRFWEKVVAKRKVQRSSSTTTETKKPRAKRTREDSGDESTNEKTEPKKRKASAKTAADTGRSTVARVGAIRQSVTSNTSSPGCFRCGAKDHYSPQCSAPPQCYACHKPGHYAKECTDVDAKAKNDEYLKRRATRSTTDPGNGERMP